MPVTLKINVTGKVGSGNLVFNSGTNYLQQFLSLEKHSRTADILGGAIVPLFFAETTITQRQVKLEEVFAGMAE